MKSLAVRCAVFVCCIYLASVSEARTLFEQPMFQPSVTAGDLPPITERIPEQPHVVTLIDERKPGEYGGELRLLMGKAKDTKLLTVYGYARLIGYDEQFNLVPDLLESFAVQDSRVFTFKLRKGHRWSDGHPFTTEDFAYYWNDIATNEILKPYGPPKTLLVDGERPQVDIVDEVTVRYSWSKPNPYFLPALAGASPLFIYSPKHYLKQFHADYMDAQELEKHVAENKGKSWKKLHLKHNKPYKQNNVDLPMLQPWVLKTTPPAERFIFERNPFYHRIDENGRQLPYIDRVFVNITSSSLVPAKTGAGESDLQARYLRLDNYTFLKQSEERNGYNVRLWKKNTGSQIALFPNLNSSDEVWRELVRDTRFRRALSLAVNRHEVNQVIYYGLVTESANTVIPGCPLYKPEYQYTWANFDLQSANALLDQIGLTERNEQGLRLMHDGRPLEITLQSAGESTEETDVLELVHDSWLQLGIKLYTRPSQREVFRNRIFSGEAMMSVFFGIDNGMPTADMSPASFVPNSQEQLQWPKWGQYYETNGEVGEEPDIAAAKKLVALNVDWEQAKSTNERERIWHNILSIYSSEVFNIGIVCGVPQPVVVNKHLNNVPVEGVFGWEPTAQFGVYKPDTFWFSDARR